MMRTANNCVAVGCSSYSDPVMCLTPCTTATAWRLRRPFKLDLVTRGREDQLADMVASLHPLMSRRRLGQGKRPIDDRTDASGREQWPHVCLHLARQCSFFFH